VSEAAEPREDAASALTLEDVRNHPELSLFVASADRVMEGLGYTEHGFRHANLTSRIAYNVLSRLEYEERTATLGAISAYLHDIGNMTTRESHAQTGAILAYQVLREDLPPPEMAVVMAAIANHEEDSGSAVSEISAAVILADKSDVHRSRVRKDAEIEMDVHDRVNYAAEQSFLRVDSDARTITLELTIDTEISHVMEYFEIFLGRMTMCRRAAEKLHCRFGLTINGAKLL
jgi:metal-dependent HD superfamily phosphatase/phosphodiesterase